MELQDPAARKEQQDTWLNDEGRRLFQGWYTQMYTDYGNGHIPSARETQIIQRIIAVGNPNFSIPRLRQQYRLKANGQNRRSPSGSTPSEEVRVSNIAKSTSALSSRSERTVIQDLANADVQNVGLPKAPNFKTGQNQYSPIQSPEKKRLSKRQADILEVKKLRRWYKGHGDKGVASGSAAASKASKTYLHFVSNATRPDSTPSGGEPDKSEQAQSGASDSADFFRRTLDGMLYNDPMPAAFYDLCKNNFESSCMIAATDRIDEYFEATFSVSSKDEQENAKFEREAEALKRKKEGEGTGEDEKKGEAKDSQNTEGVVISSKRKRNAGIVNVEDPDVEQALAPSRRKQASTTGIPQSLALDEDDTFDVHADVDFPTTWSGLVEWMNVKGAPYERLYDYARGRSGLTV